MKDKFSVQAIEVAAQCTGIRQEFNGGIEDYRKLVDNLREWYEAGKPGLSIRVTATCVLIVVANTTLVIQGPRTATNIQLANASRVQAYLATNGNNTITLVERWLCRSDSCRKKGHNC